MKDNMAMICSGLCLIHCLVGPALLLLGLGGIVVQGFENEWIHKALLIPVVLLALLSLPHSFRAHRSFMPAILVSIGISVMVSSFYLPESLELWLVIPSALLIITAHALNKKLLV